MKSGKLLSALSILAVVLGCSNQNPAAINLTNESEPAPALQAAVNSGLATLMTVSTSKYVSNDFTNILKANSAKTGPLQQFYIKDNLDGTYSFKAMTNSKYVTVQDDARLAVLNSTILPANKFKIYSSSTTDPEQVRIAYKDAYQGWFNLGESYIRINQTQTIYKVAIDKIYGSSGSYNATDRAYTWSGIFLQDNGCNWTTSGVNYRFFAKGAFPSNTDITLYIDNKKIATTKFYNGVTINMCSSLTGYNRHNLKIQFSNPTQLDYFSWGMPVDILSSN